MKNTNMAEGLYKSLLDSLSSKIYALDLDSELVHFYGSKVPAFIRKYFVPEKRYAQSITRELNVHLAGFRKNLFDSFQNPQKALKTTLEDLIFNSPQIKEEFCSKLEEGLEEATYALEVGAVKAYEIFNVKANLPIIGTILKRKLQKSNEFWKILGESPSDDLPKFDVIKSKIYETKEQAHNLLKYLGLSTDKKFAQEDIRTKYNNRMGKFAYDRIALESAYHSGNKPKNYSEDRKQFYAEMQNMLKTVGGDNNPRGLSSFIDYYFERTRERQKNFINSQYNSLGEKIIAYIGYLFKRITKSI
jgi:hypothetical protein